MSLIKGKQEFRTILDFSKGKVSKNMIKRALREAKVQEVTKLPDSESYTFVENQIKIGMYKVRILFPSLSAYRDRQLLREYGGFRVAIYEVTSTGKNKVLRNIKLDSKLFKNQYWVNLNPNYKIRMKNLTDIIMYLKRLDNLKIFS